MATFDLPDRGGETGAVLRERDWTASLLGAPATWPRSLHTVLGLCLCADTPIGIYWGEELVLLYNDAFRRLIGHRHPQALGGRARDVFREIWPTIEPMLRTVLATGRAVSSSEQLLPLEVDGRLEDRWFDFSLNPVLGEDGGVEGVFNIAIESTANVLAKRERAETERRLSEAASAQAEELAARTVERDLLATIVEVTDIMVLVVDLDYEILAINSANADEFERIYGVRPKAGDNMLGLLADQPDHQEQVRVGWAQGMRGRNVTFVEDYGDPDRVRPYYEVNFRPLRDEAGRQIGVYQFVIDVTERVRGQAQLAKALAERQVFADFVESTNAAILACDLDFGVLAANPAMVAEFGRVFGTQLRVGDNLLALLAHMPEHRAQVGGYWARALAGEEFVFADEFGDADLKRSHFEVRFHTLRDREGRRIGAFQAAFDISARVRAAAELATAQDALRQSQKMDAMGQLTGGVAHDVNNLLTPIVGGLDLLQRRGLGGEREQRLIAGALTSAERVRVLVQRLLAFARRQPLQPQPVDIAALIAGMADLVASTSGPQIKVTMDAATDLPSALADPNQIEMAILNLAVNARDAMPGGGRLTISARADDVGHARPSGLAPGRYVRLSVADTGTGMDADTLRRAVEPFFSTKGIGKGTGLGLSMVHGLAAQLGGTLAIDSRPGLGTNVELWLPATEARGEPDACPASPEVAAAAGTVLLVDDEELVRASTSDMLADLGYRVVEATSAEEALRLLAEGVRPDLVVTDHLMPGLSGTALARELHRRLPGTGVLIVSGYADVEGVASDLPRLVKPFRQADLADSLAALPRTVAGGR